MTEKKSIWKNEYSSLIGKLKHFSYTDEVLRDFRTIFSDLVEQKTPDALDQAAQGLALVTEVCSTNHLVRLKDVSNAIGKNIYESSFRDKEIGTYVQTSYAKRIEDFVGNLDKSFTQKEKIPKLNNLCLCLKGVYNSNSYSNLAKHFQYWDQKETSQTKLKISDYQITFGDQKQQVERSVIVLPDNPREAVGILYKENEPRILFAEYDPKNSLETHVLNWYGTSGAYAKHFWEFLDCSKRYPNQKRLIV